MLIELKKSRIESGLGLRTDAPQNYRSVFLDAMFVIRSEPVSS